MQVRVKEVEGQRVAEFTRPGKSLMYAKGCGMGRLPKTEYYYTKNIPPLTNMELFVGDDGLVFESPSPTCTTSCILRPFKLEIALGRELQEFCSL